MTETLGGAECRAVLREHVTGNSGDLVLELRRRGLDRPYLRASPTRPDDAGWLGSRTCLLEASEAIGRSGPELALSVSHTKGASAAVVARAAEVAGAGVDLEDFARPVSDAALARFSPSAERGFALERIEVWSVKEACYKADPGNADTKLRHYAIESFDAASGVGRARRTIADQSFAFRVFRWQAYVCAIAVALK